MKYCESSETDSAASDGLIEVCAVVKVYMQTAFSLKSLGNSDIKIGYIPIVMPDDMHEKFKARSGISRKENIFYCCPQLSYEIFVSGTYNECLAEYLRGLEEVPSGIRKLGATDEQIEDFKDALNECYLSLKK